MVVKVEGNGIKVSEKFRSVMPALTKEELAGLEESICREGCRDPLVLWKEKEFLLDGHNRLAICQRHGLKYKTTSVSLPDEREAQRWVVLNGLSRRNLTVYQKLELTERWAHVLEQRGKENQRKSLGAGKKGPQISGDLSPRDRETDREVAALTGTSHDTVHKQRVISKKADEGTKEKLRRGDLTINRVYRDIARKERLEAIEKKAAAEVKAPAPEVLADLKDGAGLFRCIYFDPPWAYDDEGCRGAAAGHYPTMTGDELAKLPVGALGHADGMHAWMWTTWPMIREGTPHRLLEAWGLRWVGEVVWDKDRIGAGRWLRSQTEVLILAVKGKLPLLHADQGNLLRVTRTARHSEKPEEFRKLVERLSPGPRLELFARRSAPGWRRWGLEA